MRIDDEQSSTLRELCDDVRIMEEGSYFFILLNALRIRSGTETLIMDALLCPQEHGGYATRLFLERPITTKGSNWTVHQIFGRPWHTWSWKDVMADQSPIQILAGHLLALQ